MIRQKAPTQNDEEQKNAKRGRKGEEENKNQRQPPIAKGGNGKNNITTAEAHDRNNKSRPDNQKTGGK